MSHSGPDLPAGEPSVDVETLREVLESHPVRLAVLFGSEVTGRSHSGSDLDVAVEFDESVTDVRGAFLGLHSALSSGLQRNDVDLSVVSDLRPRVGLAAFSDGVLLVGTESRMDAHRSRFERAVAEGAERRATLRERFDAVIDNVDAAIREHS